MKNLSLKQKKHTAINNYIKISVFHLFILLLLFLIKKKKKNEFNFRRNNLHKL